VLVAVLLAAIVAGVVMAIFGYSELKRFRTEAGSLGVQVRQLEAELLEARERLVEMNDDLRILLANRIPGVAEMSFSRPIEINDQYVKNLYISTTGLIVHIWKHQSFLNRLSKTSTSSTSRYHAGVICLTLLLPFASLSFLFVIFFVLGTIYYPIALISVALFENGLAPLNIPVLIKAIVKMKWDYFLAILSMFIVQIIAFFVNQIFQLQIPIVGVFIFWVVTIYFVTLQMYILGNIYYVHEDDLDWF